MSSGSVGICMSCSLPYSRAEKCLVQTGAQSGVGSCSEGENGSGKAFGGRGDLRELTGTREERQRAQPVEGLVMSPDSWDARTREGGRRNRVLRRDRRSGKRCAGSELRGRSPDQGNPRPERARRALGGTGAPGEGLRGCVTRRTSPRACAPFHVRKLQTCGIPDAADS